RPRRASLPAGAQVEVAHGLRRCCTTRTRLDRSVHTGPSTTGNESEVGTMRTTIRAAGVALAIAALAAGCNGGGGGSSRATSTAGVSSGTTAGTTTTTTPGTPPGASAPRGTFERTFAGRTYQLHVPAAHDGARALP